MGWHFVSEGVARNGVQMGDFYAAIIVSQDFSENLTTFLSDEPKKPELHYIVNEKINAIAPNITKKGVESIRDSIEANFISSMYGEFFKQTNLTAEKIQSYQKNISRAREMINRLAESLPSVHEKLEK